MKLDKETLLKQRFWVVLAVAVPLTLVALALLLTAVSSGIARERQKAIDAAKEKLPSEYASDADIQEEKQRAMEAEKEKTKVWEKAWDHQKNLFSWPPAFAKKYPLEDGLFVSEIRVLKELAGANESSTSFEGIVQDVDVDGDWLMVLDEKTKVEKTFYATHELKVIDGKSPELKRLEPNEKVAVTYYKSRNYFDNLTRNERTHYARTYDETYGEDEKNYLKNILAQVRPVNDKGEGLVFLGNWQWSTKKFRLPPPESQFFRYVSPWQKEGEVSTSEDIWLAQENLWIYKEMYRLVAVANRYITDFEGAGGEQLNQPYSFKNPYWELELTLKADNNLHLKIINRLPRRQKLDVAFKIKISKSNTEDISVGGQSLEPRDDKDPGKRYYLEITYPKKGLDRTGIYHVEQVLNWEAAAVKRIDHISIADNAHSHRTSADELHPFKESEDRKEGMDKKPPAGFDPKGGFPGGDPKGGFPGGDPKGGFDGGKDFRPDKMAGMNKTVNGLLRNRYLGDPKAEARRIPVALVLIVDQDHIERVLTAFRNSPLRFLMTQVLMNRYPYPLQGQEGGMNMPPPDGNPFKMFQPKGFDQRMPPGFDQRMPPGFDQRMPPGFDQRMPPGFDQRKPPFPNPKDPMPPPEAVDPGFPPRPSAASEEQESNVEMVIYGVVTLYNRYRGPAPQEKPPPK